MTLEEFLSIMKTSCSFLESEGYQLREVDSLINRNFWYEKQSETEGFRISFEWTQYGDEFHVKATQALKRFNEVEQIFQKLIGGNLSDYYTIIKNPTLDIVPMNLPHSSTENNIHFVIKNQDEILLYAKFLKSFYDNLIKDFFETFKVLLAVNNWLKNNDVEDHKRFLVIWDNTMMIRKLLIMKITTDNSFTNLFDRYKLFLSQKNSDKESPYVDMFAFFLKAEKYLK